MPLGLWEMVLGFRMKVCLLLSRWGILRRSPQLKQGDGGLKEGDRDHLTPPIMGGGPWASLDL